MSWFVCKHGGKMCDGCMDCYDEETPDYLTIDDDDEYEQVADAFDDEVFSEIEYDGE